MRSYAGVHIHTAGGQRQTKVRRRGWSDAAVGMKTPTVGRVACHGVDIGARRDGVSRQTTIEIHEA